MMEKCLARAKRKDNGEWVVGYYACESNHACFENELEYHHYIFVDVFMDWGLGGLQKIEVIPETVCRFTGLRDNKHTNTNNVGQMIFEGDIVKIEYCCSDGTSDTEIKPVTYNEQECCYYPMRWKESCQWCDYSTTITNIEVIGNIYDNAELLEGGDGNA